MLMKTSFFCLLAFAGCLLAGCAPLTTVQTGHHPESGAYYRYPQYDGEHARPKPSMRHRSKYHPR